MNLPETDAEKLRFLADWFDTQDARNRVGAKPINDEVQADLRRIAAHLDTTAAAEREKAENPLRVVQAGPPPLTREISNAIVRAWSAAKVPSQMLLDLIERGVFAPPVAEGPDEIVAPWSADVVTALNAFQEREEYHPFTCPEHTESGEVKLVATLNGWVCSRAPGCDYTQNWAHSFMAGEVPWQKA